MNFDKEMYQCKMIFNTIHQHQKLNTKENVH